jgi:hypothetical protein
MGLFAALRKRLDKRQSGVTPALVFEPTVERDRVEAEIYEWCPDAHRRDDRTIDLAYGALLLGPLNRDDPDWPDAHVSAHFSTAYTTRYRPKGNNEDDYWIPDACHHLLYGLARRFGGRFRQGSEEPWEDVALDAPTTPLVLAGRRLSEDEVLALFTPLFPNAEVVYRARKMFAVESEEVDLTVQWIYPTIMPLARRASWYKRRDKTTHYEFEVVESPNDPARIAELVRRVTDATGGIALDYNGFPWQEPAPAS